MILQIAKQIANVCFTVSTKTAFGTDNNIWGNIHGKEKNFIRGALQPVGLSSRSGGAPEAGGA